ncbi:MAG: RraA family protein, partial [Acidimicrobiia bacterium]|nr:RraA family protein [Acidimicrobiia bacterium]
LVGDADGVVVVPAGRALDIVGAAEEVTAAEDRIREAVAGGEPLLVARERLGYHDLQSRQPGGGG